MPKPDVPAGSKVWPRTSTVQYFDLKATVSDGFCSQVQSAARSVPETCTALALPPDACSEIGGSSVGLVGRRTYVSRDRATLSTCRNASGAHMQWLLDCAASPNLCCDEEQVHLPACRQYKGYQQCATSPIHLLCVRISTMQRGGAVLCGSERPERLLPVLWRAARPIAGDLHAQVQSLSAKLARCTAESSQDI